MASEAQDPLSFGDLKTAVKNTVDRGRDSTLDDTIVGQAINGAEQFICAELGGSARFLADTIEVELTGGSPDYTFPVNVDQVISLVDKANVWKLEWLDRERFNAFVVDASYNKGQSLYWTQFGYVRRTNQESPNDQYGALKIQVTPQPTSSVSLWADVMLRPGTMVDDEDFPVVPIQYQWGLQTWSAYFLGPRDIGQKAFQQNERLARQWLDTIKRGEIRMLSGNQRMLPREEYERLAGQKSTITPPTRFAQLYGGV